MTAGRVSDRGARIRHAVALRRRLLAAAWSGVRHLTGLRNAARWAREWERVGPRWSRDLQS